MYKLTSLLLYFFLLTSNIFSQFPEQLAQDALMWFEGSSLQLSEGSKIPTWSSYNDNYSLNQLSNPLQPELTTNSQINNQNVVKFNSAPFFNLNSDVDLVGGNLTLFLIFSQAITNH